MNEWMAAKKICTRTHTFANFGKVSLFNLPSRVYGFAVFFLSLSLARSLVWFRSVRSRLIGVRFLAIVLAFVSHLINFCTIASTALSAYTWNTLTKFTPVYITIANAAADIAAAAAADVVVALTCYCCCHDMCDFFFASTLFWFLLQM